MADRNRGRSISESTPRHALKVGAGWGGPWTQIVRNEALRLEIPTVGTRWYAFRASVQKSSSTRRAINQPRGESKTTTDCHGETNPLIRG